MSQTVFGQTDALALAIVDWLTTHDAVAAVPFCTTIAAERRFRLITNEADIPTHEEPASVDIFPDAESGDRQGISTAFSSLYGVHLYIQRRVSGALDMEAECALLAQLRSEIVEEIKKRAFTLDNAVHPVQKVFLAHIKNADKGLYNLNRLMEHNVFESDTLLVFKASV